MILRKDLSYLKNIYSQVDIIRLFLYRRLFLSVMTKLTGILGVDAGYRAHYFESQEFTLKNDQIVQIKLIYENPLMSWSDFFFYRQVLHTNKYNRLFGVEIPHRTAHYRFYSLMEEPFDGNEGDPIIYTGDMAADASKTIGTSFRAQQLVQILRASRKLPLIATSTVQLNLFSR